MPASIRGVRDMPSEVAGGADHHDLLDHSLDPFLVANLSNSGTSMAQA